MVGAQAACAYLTHIHTPPLPSHPAFPFLGRTVVVMPMYISVSSVGGIQGVMAGLWHCHGMHHGFERAHCYSIIDVNIPTTTPFLPVPCIAMLLLWVFLPQ